jgi:DNA-binding XRE family transcriptional regulator
MRSEPADSESKEAVGWRLELLREALTPFDQKRMAEHLGITPSGWHHYSKGSNRPTLDVAMKLCRLYGVTLDWIYRGHRYAVPPSVQERLDAKATEWASKA